jgi:hypothetical protein
VWRALTAQPQVPVCTRDPYRRSKCVFLIHPSIPLTGLQSQIKKGFYGALRIRKQQAATDAALASTRPAATVYVWDLVKTRMREAIVRHRQWVTQSHFPIADSLFMSCRGLILGQDAPDIVANTFLDQTSEEQLKKIGYGFLSHRECEFWDLFSVCSVA